jgi:DNA-binding LytR/AlgR family response regulator
MKILVVDDHAILRQGLAALLRDSGPAREVVQAGDEAQGLAMVEAHPDLDAVLLDLRLPGGDGMNAITASGKPLASASRRFSAAVSPVTSRAGTPRPNSWRSRAMTIKRRDRRLWVPVFASRETGMTAVET